MKIIKDNHLKKNHENHEKYENHMKRNDNHKKIHMKNMKI